MPDHAKFAAFILTHGRPGNVKTTATLQKYGYTGRTYLIVDNEDETAGEYCDRFGADRVIQFDKRAIAAVCDTADTQPGRLAVIYARNACFGIARDLGLDYFLELDDDYQDFKYRAMGEPAVMMRNLDGVIQAMLDFLDDTGAITVAMSQGGDHLGGVGFDGNIKKGLLRKAMNTFFCQTARSFTFVGLVNEDVNTYVLQGSRGDLFLTVMGLHVEQVSTQQSAGGLTPIYLELGTYVKSFYTVMMCPSCVKVRTMGRTDRRLHHSVSWDHAVPKILSPRYRKATLVS